MLSLLRSETRLRYITSDSRLTDIITRLQNISSKDELIQFPSQDNEMPAMLSSYSYYLSNLLSFKISSIPSPNLMKSIVIINFHYEK